MFKKCKVVMLPTNEKVGIIWKTDQKLIYTNNNIRVAKEEFSAQHLYILSDDEIEEGDWYENNGVIFIADARFDEGNNPNQIKYNKKIIATTDDSLYRVEWDLASPRPAIKRVRLPQLSKSFIENYATAYNAGKAITDVMVEYGYIINKSMGHFHQTREYFLKVNRNNTITIRSAKDSWSRKEVLDIIDKCWGYKNESIQTKEEWIEENL